MTTPRPSGLLTLEPAVGGGRPGNGARVRNFFQMRHEHVMKHPVWRGDRPLPHARRVSRVGESGESPTANHLHVLIAHVHCDVMHAIAVTLMTALFVCDAADVARVKAATNTLMGARYGTMSGIYKDVFGEDCAGPADIVLGARCALPDRRIEAALKAARAQIARGTVVEEDYRRKEDVPFVFA